MPIPIGGGNMNHHDVCQIIDDIDADSAGKQESSPVLHGKGQVENLEKDKTETSSKGSKGRRAPGGDLPAIGD